MKEVIIFGCGQTYVECPLDTTIELWTVNSGWKFSPKVPDRVFIMDDLTEVEFPYEAMKHLPCIVHPRLIEGRDNIQLYPIDEVKAMFNTEFFTSSICYMIAQALLEGYDRLVQRYYS